LNAVIPIPLPKKKRISVRIRFETGTALRSNCGCIFISEVTDVDELSGVMLGAFCRVIYPPESKDILGGLEKFLKTGDDAPEDGWTGRFQRSHRS
jgi:hypothetical protein